MKKINPVLSAVVVYKAGSGKCRTVTEITIKLGGLIDVATATKGGRYSQADALAEYRRNPKSFTLLDGHAVAVALKAA
jgi:hypothetical protein